MLPHTQRPPSFHKKPAFIKEESIFPIVTNWRHICHPKPLFSMKYPIWILLLKLQRRMSFILCPGIASFFFFFLRDWKKIHRTSKATFVKPWVTLEVSNVKIVTQEESLRMLLHFLLLIWFFPPRPDIFWNFSQQVKNVGYEEHCLLFLT